MNRVRLYKNITFLFIFIPIVLIIIAFGYRNLQQKKLKKATTLKGKNSIEILETQVINDARQYILLRGQDKSKPILLFVHGGGYPAIPFTRQYEQELSEHFVLVHYDQRNVGKSYDPQFPPAEQTLAMYVKDLLSLSESLRERFKQEKIYLIGQSFGSLLAIKAIQQHPEYYHAYLGVSQIVNMKKGDQLSYDYVLKKAKEAKNQQAIQELEAIDRENYSSKPKDLMTERKWLNYFGGAVHKEGLRDELKWAAIFSPEYEIRNLLDIPKAATRFDKYVYPEILKEELDKTTDSLAIPVYLVAGRHDYHVPSVLSESFYEDLKAPKKDFIWFEDSGHALNYEQPKKFRELVVELFGN